MEILDCSYNQISVIPAYQSLTELNCSHCRIGKISFLPELLNLDCTSNFLVNLPKIPLLKKLYCTYNKLIEIVDYPELKECYCDHNAIVKIDKLPALEKFDCSYNKLTHLPVLPQIKILAVAENKIKSFNNRTVPKAKSIHASYYYLLKLSKNLCKRIKTFRYNISNEKFDSIYLRFLEKIGLKSLYAYLSEQVKTLPKWSTTNSEEEKTRWVKAFDRATKGYAELEEFFHVIEQCFKNCYILDIDIMATQLIDFMSKFLQSYHDKYFKTNTQFKTVLSQKPALIKFIKEIYLRLVQIEIVM